MTSRAHRRPARSLASILAILGLLAGMIVPGTSLAASPSPSAAPTASPSPSASSGPSAPATPSASPTASSDPSAAPSPAATTTPAASSTPTRAGGQVGTSTPAPTTTGKATERPAVPEIFNTANPRLVSPALTGVLPAGFQEQTVINGLTQPTNVEFAPNGKIFVAEKSGIILEYDSLADTTPVTFADLSQEVMDYWDRGLLSMAIDPGLTTGRPYIYVLYAFDAPIGGTAPTYGGVNLADTCPTPPGVNPPAVGCVISGRLSRLTVSGNGSGNTMAVNGEKVLINDWCQQYPSHSIGTVMMGTDGQLWVTGGEGAAFTTRDYGQYTNPCGDPPSPAGTSLSIPTAEGGSLRAQDAQTPADPQNLSGTLIRVDPDTGLGSPGNPNAGNPDANLARVLAYGLRNPFRFTLRPGTNEPWIGMVGNVTWESIFRDPNPTAGLLNFGWPCYEGPALNDFSTLGLNLCKNLYNNPSSVTKPYFAYNHSASIVTGDGCTTGSSSISGLAFGTGNAYPSHYTSGGMFFSDYSRNCIWFLPAGANGLPDPTKPEIFETNATGPVHLVMGPDGNLYYSDFGGSIRRIVYSATNHTPVASFTASATYGPAPLTINFDASGSTDADPGDTLSYSWDLNGDGVYGDATGVTASRVYNVLADIPVSVKVTDSHGASSTSTINVFPGDTPPVVTISSPTNATTWKVGDVINMTADATDSQQTLPDSAFNWTVLLHHCYTLANCHVHALTGFVGRSGQLIAPDHGYPSYLEFDLTVTDAVGLAVTTVVTSYPQTVNLTFLTNPAGLQVYDGDEGPNQPTPVTRPVIIGSTVSVSAPTPQTLNGIGYAFGSWSDGGAQSHDITAPASATTYTATYTSTGATAVASDTFGRAAATGGWGTADLGGAWTTNPAAQFALTGSGGTISNPTAGKTGSALLGVSARDVDVTFTVASDRIPTGSGQYPAAIIRHQAGGQEYWIKLHIAATGAVYLGASAWSGGVEKSLGPEVATGGTQEVGIPIEVRVEVTGANPTTIVARSWDLGDTEPTTWMFSATDSTAALQSAGRLGLRATTSGSTTNSPTLFTFGGYLANAIGGSPPPPPPPATIATDTWTRTVANGWGTATTGGAWTLVGGNPAFAADGTGGTIQIATAGSRRYGLLAGASALNTDETFTIASDKAVVGTGQYAYAILRHQAGGAEYWGKIHFSAAGAIFLNASAYSGTAEVALGPEVNSGLTRVPGTAVNVRFQVIGTSPATIRGRVWAVGATEPTTWTFTDTDATAALQVAGTVGLRATVSSTSTNVPVTFRFDNLTVLDLGAGATPTVVVRANARAVPRAVTTAPSVAVPYRRTQLTVRTVTAGSARIRPTDR